MSAFSVDIPTNGLQVNSGGVGSASFTVSRQRPGRRCRLLLDPSDAPWLRLNGPSERDIEGTTQVVVVIACPPAADDRTYTFRLDATSVEDPENDYMRGPAQEFRVPGQQGSGGNLKWVILAVAAAMLLVTGVATWLVKRGPNKQAATAPVTQPEPPPIVRVPEVRGKSVADAKAELSKVQIEVVIDPSVPATQPIPEHVFDTVPKWNESVPQDKKVHLQVAATMLVPNNLVGRTYTEAVNIAKPFGLRIRRVAWKQTDQHIPKTVAESNPAEGTPIPSDGVIRVTMESPTAKMPKLQGSYVQVLKLLNDSGFVAKPELEVIDAPVIKMLGKIIVPMQGRITDQSILEGEIIGLSTPVKLKIGAIAADPKSIDGILRSEAATKLLNDMETSRKQIFVID